MTKQRVAVVGAGAAGLCAARYLAENPDQYEFVVFERSDKIGGMWVYSDETGTDKYGWPPHSVLYSNLRTNLPKQLMQFPDFPFDSNLPSYPSHHEVLKYVGKYCQNFGLKKYIQFCTNVDVVRPIRAEDGSSKVSWEILTSDARNRDSGIHTTSVYDAVMVCNGHYCHPKIPKLNGVESFPGLVLHSRDYRYPSTFKGQTVLLVGANQSGIDISIDIATEAKMVYLSHWKPRLTISLPENVDQAQPVELINGRTVTLTDGAILEVDAIMYCTGYEYSFPFLHPDCNVCVNDGRVTPLYKHCIHTMFPSLSFIGITGINLPFLQSSIQVRFALAVLDGSLKLPSQAEMETDEERDYQQRLADGWQHRHAHYMKGERQWVYNAELLNMMGAEQVKPVIIKLCRDVAVQRYGDPCNYKRMNIVVIDDENYEAVEG